MTTKTRGRKGAVTKAAIPNLDPYFFLPMGSGSTVTSGEIEAQPYRYHPWVHAAARSICMNITRLPKRLTQKANPEEHAEDHEVLRLLANPNPYMDQMRLWQAILLGLLLPTEKSSGGQVFLLGSDKMGKPVDFRKGLVPLELYPYTDKYVSPKKDPKTGKVAGWVYEVPGLRESKREYLPSEVIRINLFNPYDWTAGISWYTPAALAVVQDIKSDIYNTMLFDNDARVSGLLQSDQALTEDQVRIAVKRWYENYGGPGRNNRVAALGAGMKYQQMGLSQSDMQYVQMKDRIRKQIIASFQLNEIALGNYEQINMATIVEGRRMLWQDTYQPLDQLIWSSINDQWIQFVDGGKWRGASDYSGIEALRPDYDLRAKTAQVMVSGLKYTPYLASKLVGIPLTDDHLKQYPWLDEQVVAPAPLAFGGGGDGANPASGDGKAVRAPLGVPVRVKLEGDEGTKFSWDYIHRVLDPGEKRFLRELERLFVSQRNRMQDKVDAWLEQQAKAWKQLTQFLARTGAGLTPERFMLEIDGENVALQKLLAPLVKAQLVITAQKMAEEIGPLIEWSVTDQRIAAYIAIRKNEIKQINTTTFEKAHEKIGEAIKEAINTNATPYETAKMVKSAIADVGEIRKNQSKMIARTETGIISSTARNDIMRVEGFEYHEWVTAGDENVRQSHQDVNGEVIRIGEKFGATGLRYPNDAAGEPGEIINCRCVAVAAEQP